MGKSDCIQLEGTIIDIIHGGSFKVELEDVPNDNIVTCTMSGKIRQNHIKLVKGDSVTVELSPYDLTRGRIVYRN